MKKITLIVSLCFLMLSCSSSKKTESIAGDTKQAYDEKNRGTVHLLTRIRQLPGVVLKNGVPVVTKAANSISNFDSGEPLYILNGQIIGNSFLRINELVDNFNVKKVELLTGSDANFYGAQGAKGVINIITYQ